MTNKLAIIFSAIVIAVIISGIIISVTGYAPFSPEKMRQTLQKNMAQAASRVMQQSSSGSRGTGSRGGSCTDFDNTFYPGDNSKYNASYVNVVNISGTFNNIQDYCYNNNVMERMCNQSQQTGQLFAATEFVYCQYGCSGAACNQQAQQSTCTDMDNTAASADQGKYNKTQVTVQNSSGTFNSPLDYCGGNWLYEYQCNQTSNGYAMGLLPIFCPSGCSNGACIQQQQAQSTCTDPDAALPSNGIYNKTTVTVSNSSGTFSLSDFCDIITPHVLREFSCNQTQYGEWIIQAMAFNCHLPGCQNGACNLTQGAGCTNECSSSGAKQCSGNGYQTCGNYDADSCLEWSSITQCGAGQVCQNGNCISLSSDVGTLFVTSTSYSGNLGGLVGADSKCQARAQAAGLPGIWIAFLSDSNINVLDRIPDVVYKRRDGAIIANSKSDLFDGSINVGIRFNEFANTRGQGGVWTGSNIDGTKNNNNCNNWNSDSIEPYRSVLGYNTQDDTIYHWITWTTEGVCDPTHSHYLYCIRVPQAPQYQPQVCTPNTKQCEGNNLKTCKADGSGWDIKTCQYSCSNGVCVDCQDSDGGKNYEVRGDIKIKGVWKDADFCSTANNVPVQQTTSGRLWEFYCEGSNKKMESVSVPMNKICKSGAIVNQPLSCDYSGWPQKIVYPDGTKKTCPNYKEYCNRFEAQKGTAKCCASYSEATSTYSGCINI